MPATGSLSLALELIDPRGVWLMCALYVRSGEPVTKIKTTKINSGASIRRVTKYIIPPKLPVIRYMYLYIQIHRHTSLAYNFFRFAPSNGGHLQIVNVDDCGQPIQ